MEALGGLFILGTERHESRRIDNQLRGRAGRQGDRGSTQFYVSFEDELMRRFGGDRVTNTLNRFASPEMQQEIRLEMRMLTKQIEAAQKRVEAMNFETRKNVLRYDDVMNKQREIIYGQRRRVLLGEDLSESIRTMVVQTIDSIADAACNPHAPRESWDFTALSIEVCKLCCRQPKPLFTAEEQKKFSIGEIKTRLYEYSDTVYAETEERLKSTEVDMRENERVILLRTVDEHWMDHIDAMDQLKQGINLRAYGQNDPVIEYTKDGFDLFDDMVMRIQEDTVKYLYHLNIQMKPKEEAESNYSETNTNQNEIQGKPKQVSSKKKVGRNDPCPCGSGKKYKKCCGK